MLAPFFGLSSFTKGEVTKEYIKLLEASYLSQGTKARDVVLFPFLEGLKAGESLEHPALNLVLTDLCRRLDRRLPDVHTHLKQFGIFSGTKSKITNHQFHSSDKKSVTIQSSCSCSRALHCCVNYGQPVHSEVGQG